jgi:ABC-type uncharacterized transport system involved in gliding motility auxiliary subunit
MSTTTQNRYGASSLVLLAIAFVFAVIVSNQLFKGVRIDLTENRLYTLSDGTRRILKTMDEPINLYFYFSDQATQGVPSLRSYANRVHEMLDEFVDASDGKIRLSIVDPLPFSEEEDNASQFGLRQVQIATAADPIYMGLAGTNSVGDDKTIPFFQPDKETTLEYDIAKLVSTLSNPTRTLIGLVSGVSMTGQYDPQTQAMDPAWTVYQQAQQMFEIRNLGTAFQEVPDDISLLWIVQPKNLSAETQYAIDQFVMRGGKALIFVDPVAMTDAAATEGMPDGMPAAGQASDLPQLFHGWGIDYSAQDVVIDAELALSVSTRLSSRPTRHYGYLGISPDRMNADDIVTMDLGMINLAMAGRIKPAENSKATIQPLLTSSELSATTPASRFAFLPDPGALQDGYTPGGESQIIAARISGTLPSAFPDGKPSAADSSAADDSTDVNTASLAESAQPAQLIIVADVDMLSDPMWVQTQSFFGESIATAFASNGAFVINALESLAGSSDLIAVRSRGSYARPFTKVDELRARAESQFRATEQRLQRELADTERRLKELQSSREDSGNLLLSDEQQAEVDRFIAQRASIRKELRAVQRGLDEDIEDLGDWLRIINIGLVPVLLTLTTLIVIWRRRRREQR